MMSAFWEAIGYGFGVAIPSTVLVTAAGFILKSVLKHKLTLDADLHKEQLRLTSERSLHAIKEESARQMEAFKNQLQYEAYRQQIQYKSLQERQAEIIHTVYVMAERWHRAMRGFIYSGGNEENQKRSFEMVFARMRRMQRYIATNKLYLPDSITEHINQFQKVIETEPFATFAALSHQMAQKKEDFSFAKWMEMSEKLSKELEQLMSQLHDDFQQLIGIKHPPQVGEDKGTGTVSPHAGTPQSA
jgi:hypothetical protein